mmetsp:Transcript_88010/g.139865  ORF Transcript_88010/g.139865 Transcript_88010/m.139865 type:complete len:225 (-) Transcript_88010:563-1237(-)
MCQAASRANAGIGALTIPLVEPEPIILASHGVAIVVDLLTSKIRLWSKDPQVHHDLGGLVRNGWTPSIVSSHHPAIDEPGDLVWKPLESVGVEFFSCIASASRFSGGSNSGTPPIGIIGTQHVGRDRVLPITSYLDVDLSPVMKLRIAEDKHGCDKITIDVRVPWLHIWCLHSHLVAAVAEHVAPSADLSADQGFWIHGAHLSVRAFLSCNAWIWLGRDLHLPI